MASVQAVPVIVSSQPNSLAGATAGGSTAGNSINSELSKRFAAAGLSTGGMPVISAGMPVISAGMPVISAGMASPPPSGLNSSTLAAAAAAAGSNLAQQQQQQQQAPASAFAGIPGFSDSQLSLASLNNLKSASVASSVLSAAPGLAQQQQQMYSNMSTISNMSMVDPSFGSSPASAAGAQQALAAAMIAQQAVSPAASTAVSGKKVGCTSVVCSIVVQRFS
jgi:hypothetical protein